MNTALISIAVSKYHGSLNDLPGTLNSRSRLINWAINHGGVQESDILDINDMNSDGVEIRDVESKVEQFLSERLIDRLIVYFAGHGVRSALRQTWLLSNSSRRKNEAIDVPEFCNSLRTVGIGANNRNMFFGQLIVIADACRTNDASNDYRGSPVLLNNGVVQKRMRQDSFFSTLENQVSIHVNPRDGSPFCLFSEIMIDGLTGLETTIRDDSLSGSWTIINQKLGTYLERNMPVVHSEGRELRIEPDIYTCIRQDENPIYSKGERPPSGQKVSLPDNVTVEHMASHTDSIFTSMELERVERRTRMPLGIYRWADQIDRDSPPDSFQVITDFPFEFVLNELEFMHSGPLIDRFPDKVEVGGNFGAPALLEMYDNRFKLVPHFPNTVIGVTPDKGILLLSSGRRDHSGQTRSELKTDTIFYDEFNRRNSVHLTSKEIFGIADNLRYRKHSLPHRGVIAAYLYYNVGDHDNILRIAHYFAEDGIYLNDGSNLNFVPFDLAVLCASRIRWEVTDGIVKAFADFPKIDEDYEDNRPAFTRSRFSAVENIPLWGQVPAFSQGWTRIRNKRFEFEIPRVLEVISAGVTGDTTPLLNFDAARLLKEFYQSEALSGGWLTR